MHFLHFLQELNDWKQKVSLSLTKLSPSLSSISQDRINDVVNYVIENYKNNISLSEAAEIVNMSESSFSRYAAANFADAEMKAILSADPSNSTQDPTPYQGVQFASIPEFQAIGTAAGQQFSAAVAGRISVEDALAAAQKAAEREMIKAGYY